jgi:hypothetical protein
MKKRLFRCAFVAAFSAAMSAAAQADPVPGDYAIQIDEDGSSVVTGPSGLESQLATNIMPPPLPATFILTYYLPIGWAPVPGDVYLQESGGALSDLIRFNPASDTDAATIEFYSAFDGTNFHLADNAEWPSARYINSLVIPEIGGAGYYLPAEGEPGYVPNLRTTYTFVSDMSAAPEPTSWATMLFGLGCAGLMLRRSRRRPASAHSC